jgi:hypothetical protein
MKLAAIARVIEEYNQSKTAEEKTIIHPCKQRAMVRKGIGAGLQARNSSEFLLYFYVIDADNL